MLTTLPPEQVAAAITTPFTTRFDVNANGAIMLRGNANLTCPVHLLTPACTAARDGIGSSLGEELNDNGYPMVFTNADGDPATFNDSTATIDMPTGSTVLFAGLYWGADPRAGDAVGSLLGAAAPAPANKDRVRFRTPAGTAWKPITATDLYMINTTGAYQGFADVTALVAGAGNGVYGVADIQSGRGTDRYAGWTLVIAYSHPDEDLRSLRIYDGFGSIDSGSVSIPVTGLETPHSGPVRAEVGAVAYEGDLGKTGDGLRLNGRTLSDAANPANNAFNSTVSEGGAVIGGRGPNQRNLFGVDIDQFDASGVLGNAATSATLTMTTAGETYYPGVVTIAIDLYAPKIVTTMTGTDVNGGALVPGDEIEYRITVRNVGNDIADGVTITDAIPVHTTYVPGSLRIADTAVTDADDADGGRAGGGTAVFRLGSIPYLGTTYVTLRVTVDVNTPAGYAVTNLVNVGYTGRTTSVAVAAVGSSTASTVLRPDADLAAALTATPAFVRRAATPTPVAWTATVRNTGPDQEPAARASLVLPAGLTPGPPPAGCTAAGQVITCLLGPLLPGHQAVVTVPAVAGPTAAPDAVATVTATGTGRDQVSGNDTATASLAVNSPPSAVPDSATTTNGTPVAIDVRANDSDPDDDASDLLISIVSAPARGTAVVRADGTVGYTPVPGWTGADTFTYEVDDSHGGTGTATITVTTANALPVAGEDMRNAPPATPVVVPVLVNDTDPNSAFGDSLTVIAVGQPQPGAGTVTRVGPLVTYSPDVSFSGQAHFTYTIEDSHGGQAVGDVYVDVENAAPTAADDMVGTPFQTDALIDVLANDTDPNLGDVKILHSVGAPGTMAGGRVRYQPPAGFSGTVTFPYTMRDGGGRTSDANVTVTVGNAAPAAADGTVGTPYGRYLDVDVRTYVSDANLPPDTLRVSGASNPSNGTTVVRPDGTVRYTPDVGFSGTDHFTYTIDDGRGGSDTGRITVTVSNGLPVARPDATTVQAGVPLAIDVMANDDDDPNGDPLTIGVTALPAHGTAAVGPGRKITYTPGAGHRGADLFGYTLSDGLGSSSTTVTIGVVNSAPVARADAATTDTGTPITISPLANDDDPNTDPITLTGVTSAAHGTVVRGAGGTLTYTPASGFHGTDAISYTIEDPERLASSAVITITVRNAAPIAVDDTFLAHPQVTTPLAVLANDHDPNTGQVLSVASATAAGKGDAVLGTDGTLTYRSAAGRTGQDTFTYVVTDDLGRTDIGLVTITINGPPVAVADTVTTASGTAVHIAAAANDTDPEAEALTVSAVGTPGHGTAAITADGRVRYAPQAGFAGTETFSYGVRDTAGNSATGSITVLVTGPPPTTPPTVSPPLPSSVPPTVPSPVPPPVLPSVLPSVPSPAPSSVPPSMLPSVPPSVLPSVPPSVLPSVRPSVPPTVPDRSAATKPGERVGIPLPGTDQQGRPVTVIRVGTPAHGTVVLNADGSVTYTPAPGFTGIDTFTYTVVDADGNLAQATIVIEVGTAGSPDPSAPGPGPSTPHPGSPAPHPSASAPDPGSPAPQPSAPDPPPPAGPLPTTGPDLITVIRTGAAIALAGVVLHWIGGKAHRPGGKAQPPGGKAHPPGGEAHRRGGRARQPGR